MEDGYLDEAIDVVFGVVKVQASPQTTRSSQLPVQRLGTVMPSTDRHPLLPDEETKYTSVRIKINASHLPKQKQVTTKYNSLCIKLTNDTSS